MFRLVVLNTELKGLEIEVNSDDVTIGRSSASDIVLEQASVSRSHARIRRENDHYVIVDLRSKNGVRMGGQRIERGTLNPNGVFAIGDVEIRFEPLGSGAEAPSDAVTLAAPSDAQPAAAPQTDAPASQPGTVAGAELPVPASTEPRPLTTNDLASAAQAPPTPGIEPGAMAPMAPAAEPSHALAYVLLGLLALAGATLLFIQTRDISEPAPAINDAIMVKIGQEKVWRPPHPFVASTLQSEDDGIVMARADGRYIILKGLASGTADVTAQSKRGGQIRIRVVVRGRKPPLDQQWANRTLTQDQRLKLANAFILQGNNILEERPYEAMIKYRQARLVLEKGFALTPPLYNEARDLEKAAENEVARQWEKHRRAYNVAFENNDMRKAVEELRMLQDVIPDPDDIRRQKVEYLLRKYAPEIARKRQPS